MLAHARSETERTKVQALVFVGDAMEEPIDELCATAGELGLRGVPAFMFQEGSAPVAENAYREIARTLGLELEHFTFEAPGVNHCCLLYTSPSPRDS